MKSLLKTGGSLLVLAALAVGVATGPANAQDAASIQSIQQQIQSLQSQLRKLQAESAHRDAELKRAQDDAAAARAQAAEAQKAATMMPAPPPAVAAAPPFAPPPESFVKLGKCDHKYAAPDPNTPSSTVCLGNVSVTLGGFVDATGIYRQRNENAGLGSSFSGIPYPQSPNNHTGETRGTAQASRLSLLVQASPYDGASLAGYVESDFNSAGSSSNSTTTNSYTMRVRQAYVQFDDGNDNFHLLAGQAWSLLTPFTSGLTPRKENIPMVIDSTYVPGFVYSRQPQIRVSTNFGSYAFFGISAEAPQSTFGGTLPKLPAGSSVLTTSVPFGGATGPAGTIASGGLNPLTTYSYNTVPDFVVKAAFEPGFGHYELYGIGRFIKDEKVDLGGSSDNSKFGGGIGASAFLPIAGIVDVSGSVLGGYGIGRYGASGLPDATYKANGSPEPLPEVEALVGVVGHATPKLDLFTYVGTEQVERKYGTAGGAAFGYGAPTFDNSGCETELSAAGCVANTKSVTGVSVGAWYKWLKGGYGTLMTGVNYEYDRRAIFDGKGGAPSVDENIVYLTLRYLPFQ